MATSRGIYESKSDLKTAADDTALFKKTIIKEPTSIDVDDLPLFVVLDTTSSEETTSIDPFESCYDVTYIYEAVIVMHCDCPETEVITQRDAYLARLFLNQKTNDYHPFVWTETEQKTSHWGNVEAWFVVMEFSRFTIEDFT